MLLRIRKLDNDLFAMQRHRHLCHSVPEGMEQGYSIFFFF